MSGRYILDEVGEAVEEPNLLKWAEWFETSDRGVALTEVGAARVSTVFLGVAFNGKDPLVFETMVFGGPLDEEQMRYRTRAEAVAGHAQIVERVRAASPTPEEKPKRMGSQLVFRIEGSEWCAYAADPSTREGEFKIGSIRLALVQRQVRRDQFVALMTDSILDVIEEMTGERPVAGPRESEGVGG